MDSAVPESDAETMDPFIEPMLAERSQEKFQLHEDHLNAQLVRVLRTIGYDRHYVRANGQYLFDEDDVRYLDLLSGFGTFALGRNHPVVKSALTEVVQADLPNLVQMDVSPLSGLLAEALVRTMPSERLSKVFFANSGTETVEGAIKFARYATSRAGVVYLENGFHGLTYGALTMNGEGVFKQGFGPLLSDFRSVPLNDLDALDHALRRRDVACFMVEPIQGKGVNIPDDDYLPEAARLCRKYGTLLVADEVQCGLGRTGKMWAVEHWGVEPDMVLTAKALSGGHVPVGAIVTTPDVFDRMFDRMDRAVVHGSTFGKNNLAMAAGLASLRVIEEEGLVENARARGEELMQRMADFPERFEFVKAVRGRGLMLAIEFGAPKSLKLRAAWSLLARANPGLFCQMVLIPLFKDHQVLAQVAGHASTAIKLIPPLVIDSSDVDWTVQAFEKTIADCHRVPGSIWELGTTLAGHAMASRKAS